MRRWQAYAALAALVLVCGFGAAAAEELGDAAIDEIVDVLHAQGLIDEEQRDRILMKHHTEQVKAGAERSVALGLAEGWEFSGDLRLRYEAFRYDDDDTGVDRDNRDRLRYRARIGFKKKINDWVKVGMRFASGTGSPTARNRTLGDDEDFDPDELFIDLAWAEVGLPRLGAIESRLEAGKIANPFRWRHGKDVVIWDTDLTLEGGALRAKLPLGGDAGLFMNAGYFVDDENSTSKDPYVVGVQLGGETKLAEDLEAGLRTTGYWWRGLDADFIERAEASGNLPSAFENGHTRIGDVSAFLKFGGLDEWPILVYGTAVKNFLADDALLPSGTDPNGNPIGPLVSVDEEDLAWGIGLEIGDARKWFKLGGGFFHVEANAVIAQFTDSNLFDGFTNRRGWVFYGSRQIARGTELRITFYDGDAIEDTGASNGCRPQSEGDPNLCGPFARSIENADRQRLQTHILISF
jgi:hypothetical protein